MKKRTKHSESFPPGIMPKLIFLMTFFFIGAIIGSFFAANLSPDSQSYLTAYLRDPVSTVDGLQLSSHMVVDLLLLVAAFLSAYLKAGVLVIPMSMTTKGFFLSLFITSFVKVFGFSGYPAAFAASFISGFLSVTCLLLLGIQAFQLSLQRIRTPLAKRKRFPIDRAFYLTACICMVVTIVSSIVHVYVTPMVGRAATGLFY